MSTNLSRNNINYYLRLALMQAYRSLGKTLKNPSVGCVLVKNSSVIGSGFTSVGGRPHAEQNAIKSCNKNLSNSSLYVTLEPCSNYGKTPPCTMLIAKKKIKKVYFSIHDPDIRSFKKSKKFFNKSKIRSKDGFMFSEAQSFYKSYIKFKKNKIPFITSKIAISKDFYTVNKKSRWITNKFSRARAQIMRSQHDCVLTGVNTILIDNPNLTCRINGLENRSPTRILLDKNLKTPIKSNVVTTSKKIPTIIFYNLFNKKKIIELKRKQVKLVKFPIDSGGNFNLRRILFKIGELGFSRIFLESGINLTTNFLRNNLVDEIHLFISNEKVKKNGDKSIKKYMKFFSNFNSIKNNKVNLFGDTLVTYVKKNV